jgi:hypothetical protein
MGESKIIVPGQESQQTETLPWEKKIQVEVLQFSQAVFSNFKHLVTSCLKHLPDELDPQQRSRLMDYAIDGFCGIFVNVLCTYGNTSADFQALVIENVNQKFDFVRENETKMKELAEKIKNGN